MIILYYSKSLYIATSFYLMLLNLNGAVSILDICDKYFCEKTLSILSVLLFSQFAFSQNVFKNKIVDAVIKSLWRGIYLLRNPIRLQYRKY